MLKNGIDRIKISVSDMEASKAFFGGILEMSVAAELELDSGSMQQLWGLPAGTTAKAACLKNDEQGTMLELIQFKPNSGEPIRTGAKAYDLGMFDVAVRAKNIDAVYADLRQQGFEFISPPVVYTADWANVKVKEVIIIGPDQMPVAFIERLSEPIPVIKGRFGTMVDSAQIVKNIDNVSPFYTDILGYTSVFDKDLPDGLIDEVLDLPEGTHSRMAFLLQLETNTPAIELIHCSAPGRDLSDRIKPTNPGLFSLAFQTDDLDALTGKIQSAGYRILSGPIEMETGIHGKIKTVIVEGPNKALLEFFEK